MKRMTYILILNLILILITDAQVMRRRVSGAVAPAQKLLDAYPSAAAAYSMRKLRDAYAGSALRVRRDNDNAEQDIGFLASGHLDTTSLKTFVGGNNGFGVTWYDQSGNSIDGAQSTAANQPTLVAGGVIQRQNNQPTWYSDANDFFIISSSILGAYSVFVVVNTASSGVGGVLITDSLRLCAKINAANQWGVFNGTVYVPANTDIRNSLETIAFVGTTNGNGSFYLNNSGDGTYSGSAGSTTERLLATSSSQGVVGYVPELVIWNSDQTSNLAGIFANINTVYSTY